MSLDTTKSRQLLEDIQHKLTALYNNCTVLEKGTVLPHDYTKVTEDIVYAPSAIWVEWESFTGDSLRVEGYCIKFEDERYNKTLYMWCIPRNELVEVNINPLKGFHYGALNEKDTVYPHGLHGLSDNCM